MCKMAKKKSWKAEAQYLIRKNAELQEEIKTLKNPADNSQEKVIKQPTIKKPDVSSNKQEQEKEADVSPVPAPEQKKEPEASGEKEETLEVDEPEENNAMPEKKEEKFKCPECDTEVTGNQEKCSNCNAELEWED